MKLKKKQDTGLVVDEISYKKYYPELSKVISYGQFIGEYVVESSTHCIGSQKIIDPKGRTWEIYNNIDVDLSKYLYKGEPVFVERQSGNLFKCSSIRLSDELYVTSEFGCVSITKLPPKAIKDSNNHVVTLDIDMITGDFRDELLKAIEPCSTDVTIISIIKSYLSEVV